MAEAATFVDNEIAASDVTLFGKSYCPYTKKAVKLLTDSGLDSRMNVIMLDEDQYAATLGVSKIQDYLQFITGQRTVPRVFVCGASIGGCAETEQKLADGTFHSLLKNC